MTRTELRNQIRLSTVVEDTNVSDTELDNLLDTGLHWIDSYYPFPVTIIELANDSASPAFAEEFHWILVDWTISQLMVREEYFEVADRHLLFATNRLRDMVKFYTGGRT